MTATFGHYSKWKKRTSDLVKYTKKLINKLKKVFIKVFISSFIDEKIYLINK